jgi:hypothetical protein
VTINHVQFQKRDLLAARADEQLRAGHGECNLLMVRKWRIYGLREQAPKYRGPDIPVAICAKYWRRKILFTVQKIGNNWSLTPLLAVLKVIFISQIYQRRLHGYKITGTGGLNGVQHNELGRI